MADQADPQANPPRPGDPVPQGGLDPTQVFGAAQPGDQGTGNDDDGTPPQDPGPPPPPPGQAATKEMGFDDEDITALKEVGNYRYGSIVASLTNDNIAVPDHPETQFDEERFLTLLRGSVSLTKDEKWRIIQAVPNLVQGQIDDLQNILEEEYAKFADLSPKHLKHLMILENKHAEDWRDLQSISQQERAKNTEEAQADEIRKQLGI